MTETDLYIILAVATAVLLFIWRIRRKRDPRRAVVSVRRILDNDASGRYACEVEERLIPIQEAGGSFKDDKGTPFQLKRNEQYIGSIEATLYVFRSDGYVGGHGLTLRVKLARGLYYRIGGGRFITNKNWMTDQKGVLHFTNNRIIFDGAYKNMSVRWNRVIDFGCNPKNGKQLLINRDSGSDWFFKIKEKIPVDQMATIALLQTNNL